MTPSTDALMRNWRLVALVVYTILVVLATLAAVSGVGDESDLADSLRKAHEEEIDRLQELQDRELEDRDRILDEYQQEIEVIRNDYWTTINQIEENARDQRADIVRRIYEDPDAAAQILSDKYGLVYVP